MKIIFILLAFNDNVKRLNKIAVTGAKQAQ
jgi:hypothetical protein